MQNKEDSFLRGNFFDLSNVLQEKGYPKIIFSYMQIVKIFLENRIKAFIRISVSTIHCSIEIVSAHATPPSHPNHHTQIYVILINNFIATHIFFFFEPGSHDPSCFSGQIYLIKKFMRPVQLRHLFNFVPTNLISCDTYKVDGWHHRYIRVNCISTKLAQK